MLTQIECLCLAYSITSDDRPPNENRIRTKPNETLNMVTFIDFMTVRIGV